MSCMCLSITPGPRQGQRSAGRVQRGQGPVRRVPDLPGPLRVPLLRLPQPRGDLHLPHERQCRGHRDSQRSGPQRHAERHFGALRERALHRLCRGLRFYSVHARGGQCREQASLCQNDSAGNRRHSGHSSGVPSHPHLRTAWRWQHRRRHARYPKRDGVFPFLVRYHLRHSGLRRTI